MKTNITDEILSLCLRFFLRPEGQLLILFFSGSKSDILGFNCFSPLCVIYLTVQCLSFLPCKTEWTILATLYLNQILETRISLV